MFIETVDQRYILNSKYITAVYKDEKCIVMLLNDDNLYEISEGDYKRLIESEVER